MAFPVDDERKTAVFPGPADLFLHGCQKQIRADYGCQLPVDIDRRGAHDPDVTGKGVDFHIREDGMPGFHCLLVPFPGRGVI